MYDLEVASPEHNFLLPNGIVTSNSHAVCYTITGYACAFFKHHFPLEWWCAVLNNATRNEIDGKFWAHCGHLINVPDIKTSKQDFYILGDRIQAPLSLLNGIGEMAHKEICDEAPFTDIKDFCEKIYQRRVRNGTQVGEKLKLARSALNRTIIAKLIVSGTMDALFPTEASIYDKLNLYMENQKIVSGTKVKLDAKFATLTGIQQYQMRKDILPSFSQPILPLILNIKLPECLKKTSDGKLIYTTERAFKEETSFPVVSAPDLEYLEQNIGNIGGAVKVGVVGYVTDTRPFTYQTNKQAIEILLDLDGHRLKFVKWPWKEGLELPDGVEPGAIVSATLVKTDSARPWSIQDICVVQPKLDFKNEEESK